MATTVWVSSSRSTRFHASPDCRYARNQRLTTPLTRAVLSELKRPIPCRHCFPEAPHLRVWHPLCLKCGHPRPTPCPHNGAVLARVPRYGQWTGKFGDTDYDPDMIDWGDRWVWPENAWRYTLVNSAQAS